MIYIAMLGILLHILGPFISIKGFKVNNQQQVLGVKKFFRFWSPQRCYDIATIVTALICYITFYQEFNQHLLDVSNPFIISLLGLSGILLPIIIWKVQKREIIFKGKHTINIDILLFLPFSAFSEELIWRFIAPLLLNIYIFESTVLSIFISSIGFILLHIPLGGVKVIPYFFLFTLIAVILFLSFGILTSIVFHISHNIFIQLFYSRRKKIVNNKIPVVSETDW